MLDRWRASGREVAVLGLAKSGIAATRLLRREGIPVYASDRIDDARTQDAAERLRAVGAEVQLGGHDLVRIGRSAGVVVSPGVPPDAQALELARHAGVEIVSEIDLGAATLSGVRYAAITGTNGKSTTTALTAQLLSAAGFRALAAGNIGEPLAEVALAPSPPPQWIALEISSFQLHDTHHLVPAVGVLTNLAPDHLDRYRALDDYYADKRRLFLNDRADSYWITNRDDSRSQAMVVGVRGIQARFSLEHPAEAWYQRSARRLMLEDRVLLAREELQLLGDHNVANALAAALVAQRAGGSLPAIADGLRGFRALPHRLEPVKEVSGVLWINDSKATNIASTAVAVDALERPFVLLLGGRHKGEPYTGLAQRMRGRCRAVIAFGESKEIILKDLAGLVPLVAAGSFEDVIGQARRLAQKGDAVLLSPACSSYDMFVNYEDRGARFRAAVEGL